MQSPRLAHERAHGSEAVGEDAQRRIVGGLDVAAARHAEGGDRGVVERLAREQVEELDLLGVRAGEAGLDQVDAELVEAMCDAQLLLGGEGHPLPLHPVSKGGVVKLDSGHVSGLLKSMKAGEKRK